jgi:hypothetical protein
MIATLWDSATSSPNQNSQYQQPSGIAPVGLVLASSAAANPANVGVAGPIQVDLNSVQNVGDYVSIELEVKNPPTKAPAANSTLTVFAACSSSGSKQPAELATAASSGACVLGSVPGQTQVYTPIPVFYASARYLYIWFQYSGDANTAVPLGLRLRVNTKTG